MPVTGWFLDGFDYCATANIAQRWTLINDGQTIDPTGGRRNSGTLRIYAVGYQQPRVKRLMPDSQDVIAGWAFKIASPCVDMPICTFADGATNQVEVVWDAVGHLVVRRNGTVLGTSTNVWPDWIGYHYLEVAAHIASGTAGWVIVRVDGTTWLNLTGVNTQATANATVNWACFYGGGSTGAGIAYLDDLVLRWGSGLSSADLLGDLGVTAVFPTADSTGANWAYGGAASHFDAVNDAAPDDDTSYDQSSTIGAEQRFVFGDVPAGVVVPGIELVCYARKTDAGTRNLKFFVVTNGQTRYSSVFALSDGYLFYSWFWITNPVTNLAWTAAEVNAAEFGYTLDS